MIYRYSSLKHVIALLPVALLFAVGCRAFTSELPTDQQPGQSVGQHILFDSGWRFYREPAANNTLSDWGTAVTDWKSRPYSADSLPDDTSVLAAMSMDVSATDWQETAIGQDVFHGRIGYQWFRTTIAQPMPAPAKIHFGGVDDNATVFLNGTFIGQHQGYDVAFDVSPRAAWQATGNNVLAVLVENTGGPGGITGPVLLQSGAAPAVPEASIGFDDSSWRVVHLPHDYIVEGTFDPQADVSHGFLPKTTAWYRKSFTAPPSFRGKSVWIEFDGVYRDAKVWINGKYVGEHQSGYAGFRFDIAKYLNYGGPNEIAVHVDPTHNEGWFYEGGGIYRHVWLNVAYPLHIAPDGTFVTSKITLGQTPSAVINISTELTNALDYPHQCVLRSSVIGPDGKQVGSDASDSVVVPAESTLTVTQSVAEPDARLWSIENPQLYSMRTLVVWNGKVVDDDNTNFGLRTIRFDADKGFFLNGRPVKIKGTCNHQDFAGVGSAIPDNLLYWRVRKLKEMGCNAYRTSHNEVASALLDACDRLGMLVMDETRHFGDTQSAKSPYGTPVNDLSDLKQMVRRDRNHPSVILWSIENEEPLQGGADGVRIGTAMKKVVDELDGTRPVTAAMNGGWGQGGLSDVLDVQGFNYAIPEYDSYHAQHPASPLFGSETSSDVSTRGEYADNYEKGYVRAYDTEYPTVSWGASAEGAWAALATRPFMAGGFVWTGFDYRGEPTPYGWPDVNSNFGIMDMCGFPKDNYYYYQAWWGDKPLVHILPHWNWAGKEGQPITVWVYGNTDEVELLLNGTSLGVKDMPKYHHLEWSVPYAPGTLTADGYTDGKLLATDRAETTGEPARIRLSAADIGVLHANGEDSAVIAVDILDSRGRIVPTAGNLVKFTVDGGGHIDGVGNGDPSCHEPDKASERSAFNGRCVVVVQTNEGAPEPIRITAKSDGLRTAQLTLTVK
jgi:beta-galactosidase